MKSAPGISFLERSSVLVAVADTVIFSRIFLTRCRVDIKSNNNTSKIIKYHPILLIKKERLLKGEVIDDNF